MRTYRGAWKSKNRFVFDTAEQQPPPDYDCCYPDPPQPEPKSSEEPKPRKSRATKAVATPAKRATTKKKSAIS